jgi:uncharacterized alkaline shock family protein YloU
MVKEAEIGERNKTAVKESKMSTELGSSSSNEVVVPTEDGDTVIGDIVVAKVAAAAAQEVGGIHGMASQGMSDRVSGAFGAVAGAVSSTKTAPSTQGVSVEVGKQEAIVSLNIVVEYGAKIPQVVAALRKNISTKVQTLTGLTVKAINVEISDVHFPEEDEKQTPDLQ